MRTRCRRWLLILVATGLAAGCGKKQGLEAPPRSRTGAEEAARAYFEALIQRDWPSAYKALDAQSRAGCSEAEFARRARAYYRDLGFEPNEVKVLTCDERGDEAIAHVNLKGIEGSSPKFYKDAVGLRRQDAGWAVVLPLQFGKAKPKKK